MTKKRRSKAVRKPSGEQPTPDVAGRRRRTSLGTAAFIITALAGGYGLVRILEGLANLLFYRRKQAAPLLQLDP